MKYPVQLREARKGIKINVPEPELVKPTYEQLIIEDATTPFPFWAKIWASSIAICDFLIENPQWVQGKTVLELGAGMGLPSFSMAKYATRILISDHAADAVELLHKNINHLQLTNTSATCIDWNKIPNHINADIILLSDVNYAPNEFESLLKILNGFLEKGSTLIIATPQRMMGIPFIESLQPYIKESITKSIFEEDKEVFISIYILYK